MSNPAPNTDHPFWPGAIWVEDEGWMVPVGVADLRVTAEREACAKIADGSYEAGYFEREPRETADLIASAIRARKDKTE